MSWTDKIAFENILKLKEDFNIKTAVVTGAGKGGDAELYGHHFERVIAVDISMAILDIARERLAYLKNVRFINMLSANFIRIFQAGSRGTVLFFLDAHYYDPTLRQKWVVVDELQALQGFEDCVIIIHDYDNGLGHLIYAGEHLGWNVVGDYIQKVNPDFHYYTNTREMCDIYDEKTIYQTPLHVDEHILDTINYANSSDVKRYRGILFATPKELNLNNYKLISYKG